jgi:hypothetical protein
MVWPAIRARMVRTAERAVTPLRLPIRLASQITLPTRPVVLVVTVVMVATELLPVPTGGTAVMAVVEETQLPLQVVT